MILKGDSLAFGFFREKHSDAIPNIFHVNYLVSLLPNNQFLEVVNAKKDYMCLLFSKILLVYTDGTRQGVLFLE